MRRLRINPAFLLLPVFLSLGGALLEGISAVLLIPLTKGIITSNFAFVKQLPVIKVIVSKFPQMFAAQNTALFILLVLIILICAMFKNVLQYLSSLAMARQFRRFASNLRKLIFSRYLKFGKSFFDQNNAGYLQDVLLNFTAFIENNLKDLGLLLNQLFMLAVYMVLMILISWRLTLFIIIIFPVLNYVTNWLTGKIEKTSAFYAECHRSFSNKISNILTNIPLVKLYTAEKKEEGHFGSMSDQLAALEFSMDKKRNFLAPAQEMIILMGMLFLLSATAFMFVKQKSGSISRFMVFFYLLKKTQGVFGALNYIKTCLASVSGPLSVIFGILDDKEKAFISEGREEFRGLERDMEFRHLNFSYKKEAEVLKDVSFSIKKGEMVAIVGPTGAGKTTLINLILRFYDTPAGSILIDGRDIGEFTLKSLMANLALVSQDVLLFNDTLRNNIVYGLEGEIPEEKVLRALEQSRLHDFVTALPDGLDTNIGDKGVKLSGGEKQRVSIARALLKGAHILILDEATSSLDTKTEKLIQEAINEATKDKTSIVIAHRLSTIRHADRVLVIEDGRLIEQGSLEELLGRKGKFYEYWQAQKFY